VKLPRSDEVSSVLDFSKKGRRAIEGPPEMILLVKLLEPHPVDSESEEAGVRGGEYELHGDGGSAPGWISSDCYCLQEERCVRTGSSFLF
jgi:hypothetical protein